MWSSPPPISIKLQLGFHHMLTENNNKLFDISIRSMTNVLITLTLVDNFQWAFIYY